MRVSATTPLIASCSLVPISILVLALVLVAISILGIVTAGLSILGVVTAVIARVTGLPTLLVKLFTARV